MGHAVFRPQPAAHKKKVKNLDCCIATAYTETGELNGKAYQEEKICYGVIDKMFLSGCMGEKDVVVQCTWYQRLDDCPITGLRRVAYRPNWQKDCCVSFLRDAFPTNMVLWPADPFTTGLSKGVGTYKIKDVSWKDEKEEWNVIHHHNTPRLE